MKQLFNLLFAAAVLAAIATTSCTPAQDSNRQNDGDTTAIDSVDARIAAVNAFLTDSLAKSYTRGDVCIPCPIVTATDDTDKADVRVWGDFWILNYDIDGDTLKNVSGGSHPGLMHLRQGEDGKWQVTAFEQVTDGAGFDSSAKQIFGDKYDDFMKSHADDNAREQAWAASIASHVKAHGLTAKFYQDYGHAPKPLPQQ